MGSPRDPWDPNCSHTHAQLCFTDIMIYWLKICICSLFLPTPVSFKALAKRVLLGPSVPRLPDSENWLLGLTQYQSSSSRMRVINHNWSATKQHPHPQSVAEISRHSVLSGDRIRQCETSSGVSPQGHRSVSVSCHFLLQAPQCPCSVRKRFSRDHCCRGRSKVETRLPDCGVTH